MDEVNCQRIYINVHYKKNQVLEFLNSLDLGLQKKIVVLNEKYLLGTAGTIKRAVGEEWGSHGPDSMLVAHADNFLMGPLVSFVNHFYSKRDSSGMLMGTFLTQSTKDCGIVEIGHDGKIINYVEKPSFATSNLANAAIYLLDARIQRQIVTEFPAATDFAKEVIPRLIGQMYSFVLPHHLIDIGTPERLALAIEMSSNGHGK